MKTYPRVHPLSRLCLLVFLILDIRTVDSAKTTLRRFNTTGLTSTRSTRSVPGDRESTSQRRTETCEDQCRKPHGTCRTFKVIKSLLKMRYPDITYSDQTDVRDRAKWFFNDDKEDLEACSCLNSGRYGPDCKLPCPAGTGGYMCAAPLEQCEDFCDDSVGSCLTLKLMVPRLRIQYNDLNQRQKGAVMMLKEKLDWFMNYKSAAKEACYCHSKDKIGKDCKSDCPPGWFGRMCIFQSTNEDIVHVSVKRRAVMFFKATDMVEELRKLEMEKENKERLKRQLEQAMSKGMQRILGIDQPVAASVRKMKFVFEDIKRKKRQGISVSGIEVELEFTLPDSMADDPGIEKDLTAAVVRTAQAFQSDVLPGLELDESSIVVRQVERSPAGTKDIQSSSAAATSVYADVAIACLVLGAVSTLLLSIYCVYFKFKFRGQT